MILVAYSLVGGLQTSFISLYVTQTSRILTCLKSCTLDIFLIEKKGLGYLNPTDGWERAEMRARIVL
jgi:hypothetical protein